MKFFPLFFMWLFSTLIGGEPIAVYLTIQDHPESSMTVCWIASETNSEQSLKYRNAASDNWFEVEADPMKFPEKLPYSLFIVELENLKSDTLYEFTLSNAAETYSFKTLPCTLSRPIKFVAGGDIYHDEIKTVVQMNRIAAKQNPDFALLGGDIAYSGSKFTIFKEEGERWIQFLSIWSRTMKREDGTLIPLIAAIGNHDINGRYDQNVSLATFYYFVFPTHVHTGYRILDFCSFMSLWILDSGHSSQVGGAQTAWLESTLQERASVPLKLALYHVPAYPSARAYDNKHSTAVRNFWVPLFEKYGIKIAYENHDHAYKRTHLIKNGKAGAEGVLYVGDGAWGVNAPRLPQTPKQRWYLANSAQKTHILLTHIEENQVTIQAIDSNGEIFDAVTLK